MSVISLSSSACWSKRHNRDFLRCLQNGGLSSRLLIGVYSSATESILTGGIHVWLGHITAEAHKSGAYACYLWPEQGSLPPPEGLLSPSLQPVCPPPMGQPSGASRHSPVASRIASIYTTSGFLTVVFLFIECCFFFTILMGVEEVYNNT